MTAPAPQSEPNAEQALDEYLQLLENGEPVDFERFCDERGALADELRELKAQWDRMAGVVDDLASRFDDAAQAPVNGIDQSSEASTSGSSDGSWSVSQLVGRLARQPAPPGRYASRGEVGRGGMGMVLRMWDRDLRRNLAMKVIVPKRAAKPGSDARQLGRFLSEAQITGQLDHPGIVPVHELGVGADGRLYFTMRLVRGRSLRTVYDLVHDGKDDWTVTRTLSVLLKVCEAMAYAHSKGVIHRDLKPSNIMVGRFGETYVMDWGLAKVLGREDLYDLRPRDAGLESVEAVSTDRHEEAAVTPDSPLLTMDGSIIGTPAYMAPEQARGQSELVGPAADIYAVGALLYQLLTGRMPYVADEGGTSAHEILQAVREGPPRAIQSIDRDVPIDLVALCEKAMARRIEDRYDSMLAMADDLRAFLEGRVVSAYETGALAELRKWIGRNRGMAAVALVAMLALSWLLLNLAAANERLYERTQQAQAALRQAEGAVAAERTALADAERSAEDARQSARAAARAAAEARWTSYVAGVAAADSGLRFFQAGEAMRRLDECPGELRGWEWHHLRVAADPSLAVLSGHTRRVTAVAFSADDSLLVSASWGGVARVWDVASGYGRQTLDHGGVGLSAAAFQPQGRVVALGDMDGQVTLWDAASGTRLQTLLQDGRSSAPITALAFAPDGESVYATTEGRRVWAWDVATGRRSSFPEVHTAPLTSLAISPDGMRLITASEDHTVEVWDASTGIPLLGFFDHKGAVRAVAHSPVADRVATGCDDGLVRVYDPNQGRLLNSLAGHVGPVRSVTFAADGSQLLSAGDDGSLRLWDAYTGQAIAILMGHRGPVLSAAWSHDGTALASGSADHSVRLWDRAFGAGTAALAGHGEQITALAAQPGTGHVLSAGWDARLRLWEPETRLSLAVIDLDRQATAAVAFAPDGRRLAAGLAALHGQEGHPLLVWDVSAEGEPLGAPRVLAGHDDSINAVAFSPDGAQLASAGDDFLIKLWDPATGQLQHTLEGHQGWVTSLAWHPRAARLVSGADDGSVRMWSADGQPLGSLSSPAEAVTALACSADGRWLATGSRDQGVRLYDGTSYRLVSAFTDGAGAVRALAFHPTEGRLAASFDDATIRVWDPERGSLLLTLRQSEPALALTFSDDGRQLLATSGRELVVYESRPAADSYPLRRAHAAALAEAETVFRELLDQLADPRRVIAQLEQSSSLDPDVRRETLRLARNFGTDPLRLAQTAWDLLLDREAGADTVAEALRLATAAHTMGPDQGRLLNVLGAAQYRAGQYRAALSTLERARAQNIAQPSYPASWDLLFIAMANARLGSIQLARTYLDEALSASMPGLGPRDPTTVSLELEARALVEGS